MIKIARYLQSKDKFAKYRIIAEVDQNTNDFPRDENGSICDSFDDLLFKCKFGNQIYHYGHGVLVGYIPSIKSGNTILKQFYNNCINPKNVNVITKIVERKDGSTATKTIYEIIDDKLFDDEMQKQNIIFDILKFDSEIEFKFKYKDLDIIAELLHAQLSPKDRDGNYHYISPFSSKNIPKLKVKIPEDKLGEYRKLTSNLGDNRMLIMRDIAKDFLKTLTNRQYKLDSLKADMQKTGLKNKEYIYYIGKFDEYLNFIKKKGA